MQPLSRPATASNHFKDRMSRMQELQERKRAERTGSSDIATASGDVLSGSPVPMQHRMDLGAANVTGIPMEKEVQPVTQTEVDLAARGIDTVFDPTQSAKPKNQSSAPSVTVTHPNDVDAIVDTSTPERTREFIQQPFSDPGVVKCQITRHKSFMFNSFPTYECYLKDGMRFIMAARKRKKTKGAYYIISTSNSDISRHDDNFMGKVRSNILGTHFRFFDNGTDPDDQDAVKNGSGSLRRELGFLTYESNVLGSKGPRKMQCVLPKLLDDGTLSTFLGGDGSKDSLEAAVSEDEPSGRRDEITELHNRAPKWSERVAAYTLDFKGRVTMASVKNFQLVTLDDDDTVLLQFGKVGVDDFTMDFRAPLTPIQAFAICLTSLDNKWACE